MADEALERHRVRYRINGFPIYDDESDEPIGVIVEPMWDWDSMTEAQRVAGATAYAGHRERLLKGGTVVVIGLEIALRDSALGEAALSMLEDMSLLIDRQRRSDSGIAEGRIVVLTDLSPLDRVLQAYEREQSESAAHPDVPLISRQQQLRWSRLFEDFTTIVFRPTPKFLWNPQYL